MALKPPVEVPQGAIRLNTDSQKLEFFAQDQWWQMATEVSSPIGVRAFCWGGYGAPGGTTATVNIIDFISIATGGNAVDFGDGTWAGSYTGATGTRTRGFVFGGYKVPGPQLSDPAPIDYIEIATQGNAADFGDMFTGQYGVGAVSNNVRAVAGGTYYQNNHIQYITTTSTGNAADFGDLTVARSYPAGAASPTRGLFAGGFVDQKDEIDYITIATTGNAVDFGNLVRGKWMQDGAVSSGIRAVFGNGNDGSSPFGWKDNRIDYVTIATTGNSTDFGDASTYMCPSGAQSSTRGVWFGGQKGPAGPAWITTIQKIEISTLGNPSEFGDLTLARGRQSGLSNGGGGLV